MLWDIQLHELRRYQEEYNRLDVPFKWHDATGDFNNHLSIWYHAQPHMFRLRRLSPNQVRALEMDGARPCYATHMICVAWKCLHAHAH